MGNLVTAPNAEHRLPCLYRGKLLELRSRLFEVLVQIVRVMSKSPLSPTNPPFTQQSSVSPMR